MAPDGLTKPFEFGKNVSNYFVTMAWAGRKGAEMLNRLHRRRRQRPEWEVLECRPVVNVIIGQHERSSA